MSLHTEFTRRKPEVPVWFSWWRQQSIAFTEMALAGRADQAGQHGPAACVQPWTLGGCGESGWLWTACPGLGKACVQSPWGPGGSCRWGGLTLRGTACGHRGCRPASCPSPRGRGLGLRLGEQGPPLASGAG